MKKFAPLLFAIAAGCLICVPNGRAQPGSVDLSFDSSTGKDFIVDSVVVQPEGKPSIGRFTDDGTDPWLIARVVEESYTRIATSCPMLDSESALTSEEDDGGDDALIEGKSFSAESLSQESIGHWMSTFIAEPIAKSLPPERAPPSSSRRWVASSRGGFRGNSTLVTTTQKPTRKPNRRLLSTVLDPPAETLRLGSTPSPLGSLTTKSERRRRWAEAPPPVSCRRLHKP
jgi:hypothetical protein